MKITEVPPAEPTYHIELSQKELDVLYWAIDKDRFAGESADDVTDDYQIAEDIEDVLSPKANVDRF